MSGSESQEKEFFSPSQHVVASFPGARRIKKEDKVVFNRVILFSWNVDMEKPFSHALKVQWHNDIPVQILKGAMTDSDRQQKFPIPGLGGEFSVFGKIQKGVLFLIYSHFKSRFFTYL